MPARRKILLSACAAMILGAASAHAEPLPWPKPPGPGGNCPHGYFASGGLALAALAAQAFFF
jgi:hypothetical protein